MFMVNYSTNLKQEYRESKDIKGAETEVSGRDLKKLVGAIHKLPVSTAECERGFSQMNVICTTQNAFNRLSHVVASIHFDCYKAAIAYLATEVVAGQRQACSY